jgi:hypothetical protein
MNSEAVSMTIKREAISIYSLKPMVQSVCNKN